MRILPRNGWKMGGFSEAKIVWSHIEMKLLQVVDGQFFFYKKFVLLKMFEATFCIFLFLFRGLTHWLTKRHCFAARPFFIVDRNVAKRGVDFYWVPWGLSQNHMMLGWAIRLDYDPSLRFFIVIRVWRHCACVTMHWTKTLQHSQRNITDVSWFFLPITSCHEKNAFQGAI